MCPLISVIIQSFEMYSVEDLRQLLAKDVRSHDLPPPKVLFTATIILLVARWLVQQLLKPKSAHPTVNKSKAWFFSLAEKKDYFFNARRMLAEGSKKFNGPFNVITEGGPVLMLPPDQIDLINAESKLSFQAFTESVWMS